MVGDLGPRATYGVITLRRPTVSWLPTGRGAWVAWAVALAITAAAATAVQLMIGRVLWTVLVAVAGPAILAGLYRLRSRSYRRLPFGPPPPFGPPGPPPAGVREPRGPLPSDGGMMARRQPPAR